MNKHTATMNDGTVVTRNSKTRVYAYAVEGTVSAGEVLRMTERELKAKREELAKYKAVVASGVVPAKFRLLSMDDYREFVTSAGEDVERLTARVNELKPLDPRTVVRRYIVGWSSTRENAVKMGSRAENFSLLPATVNAPAEAPAASQPAESAAAPVAPVAPAEAPAAPEAATPAPAAPEAPAAPAPAAKTTKRTRRTREQIARDLAAKHGVKIEVESDEAGDYAVELWTFDAHVQIDGAHTAIPSMEGWGLRSPAEVWAAVAEQISQAEPCPQTCSCYE